MAELRGVPGFARRVRILQRLRLAHEWNWCVCDRVRHRTFCSKSDGVVLLRGLVSDDEAQALCDVLDDSRQAPGAIKIRRWAHEAVATMRWLDAQILQHPSVTLSQPAEHDACHSMKLSTETTAAQRPRNLQEGLRSYVRQGAGRWNVTNINACRPCW